MPSTKDQALASERPPLSLGALVGAELEEQAARACLTDGRGEASWAEEAWAEKASTTAISALTS